MKKIEWVIRTPVTDAAYVAALDCIVDNLCYASVQQLSNTYPSPYRIKFQSAPAVTFGITSLRAGMDMVEARVGMN